MAKPNVLLVFIAAIITYIPGAYAEHDLGRIEVKRLSNSSSSRSNQTSSMETFTIEDIRSKRLNSLVDILDYASGIDLRWRARQGIQGDISLRASTYEQVAVLIDGLKVSDPQTGHYNLDIPLTVFDVDRVEVTKDASSSLYGAGAFAGSVNFITRYPERISLRLESLFGEHALSGQAFSLAMPFENGFSSRLSFEHKLSKAARPNTDFEYHTGSLYLNKRFDTGALDYLFGYQKKDFGADSFYSNLFKEEEEHTETLFFKGGIKYEPGPWVLKSDLYLRRHWDKFILNRNLPESVNYHTNYTYGFNPNFTFPVRFGDVSLGLDAGIDQINSTNMGEHFRSYQAVLGGINSQLTSKLNSDFRVRFDSYRKWPLQSSFTLGAGYDIIEDRLRLKCSAGRAFRIPTFTELYYNDPANRGDPDLKIESSYTFNCGLQFRQGIFDLGLEGFLRRGYDLIDWTRTSLSLPWQAVNWGKISFRGIAFNSKVRPNARYKFAELKQLSFSYNYNTADKKTGIFFSKYALDILKHQLIMGIDSDVWGIILGLDLSYNQRCYGTNYFIASLYIGKKFTAQNWDLEPFLKADNFTNTAYTEIAGVLQPGRWVQAGMKMSW